MTYAEYKQIRNKNKPLRSYFPQRDGSKDDMYDFLRQMFAIDPDCRMTIGKCTSDQM